MIQDDTNNSQKCSQDGGRTQKKPKPVIYHLFGKKNRNPKKPNKQTHKKPLGFFFKLLLQKKSSDFKPIAMQWHTKGHQCLQSLII